ncbi:nicotinate (nicotinamide) nucleotide adenylyltransferase [Candidatus Gottesmanbacteria bacterium RIFCSPHIGHO2_02_FULL_40_24]|uniref:Probable nicotinate-nucleotide adenylyltransferase n=1 Tax=Candidatus Gottesmanbacteria bacterium RIFCSPHIGHO2_01_FULL_40_15 TaxID=1798376 RepID=A0A1F5Z3R3_9BACT|nr:MAG: nicotinate (nicotinamide) nucleotide adenylyltransferase [Candidatus Gottesmanbacteria bacterium RIFCSPHIGHO2_01_FULL_40_15]OGG18674.1 MAG: nicotinate (nicotinamide) nucleotide adenylyltransferase [Candidatus Gottesmanbacteria bacterium RIFCSPHIGHO2_02_FULL_40_24]OGG22783.1 MAG: nicotinate (nicotinamide) nucleotide adenylyltransferase [Candidatus Gottesmanbacteria bacterium RIFCSPLOWO2_01_FULL_40_10]OGG22966.1 MAG: nicotinate (nicotinamide) nucleotide adenylyltransferase [Candidatus Gott
MNIAILGGRFDPPHIWHFWTAQQVLENVKDLDQVWYMPDYQNAFKPIEAGAGERLEMLQFMETGKIKTSNMAISEPGVTYTVKTVNELVKDKKNRFFWIVGSDILSEFHKWRDYQKLSRLITFLVFPRKDFPIKHIPAGFRRIEGHLMLSNVSSFIVRDRIKRGLTVSGLVFPAVEEYIRKKNLYR